MLSFAIGNIRSVPGAKCEITLTGQVDPQDSGDLCFNKDTLFTGRAEHTSSGIIEVAGHYCASLNLTCSRCGEIFPYSCEGDIDVSFFPGNILDDESESTDDEEKERFSYIGDNIDLSDCIAQEIFLNLPMKPLCREQCRGLCPICGINLNKDSCSCGHNDIDPRWAKLKDLLNDKEKGV